MEPRLTLVTLGVADVTRARAFYEALGLVASRAASSDSVAFFPMGGVVLGLYGRAALAADAGVADTPAGFSAVTLAHNVRSDAEVDRLIGRAVAAGGRLVKPGQKVFWGGYSGYVADPDGHLWEIAHNPVLPLDADGAMRLPA